MARVTGAEGGKLVAQNRRARHDYFIDETVEAGLVLTGSEVKALRERQGSIAEAHAGERDGSLWLVNAHIPEYRGAKHFGHEPRRLRKLLLHKKQLNKLLGSIRRDGVTVVPLSLYFNERGIAKLEVGLARGKRKMDKRETVKERDWQRDKARLMRAR